MHTAALRCQLKGGYFTPVNLLEILAHQSKLRSQKVKTELKSRN